MPSDVTSLFVLQVDEALGRDRAAVGSGVLTVRREGAGEGNKAWGLTTVHHRCFPGATNRQLLFLSGANCIRMQQNETRIMEPTETEGELGNVHQILLSFFKAFVYTVCLHNHFFAPNHNPFN